MPHRPRRLVPLKPAMVIDQQPEMSEHFCRALGSQLRRPKM
jgi:hypothetical protein